MKTKLLIIVFLSFTILLSAKGSCLSKILTIPSCAKDTIAVNQEGNFKNQQLKPIKTIQYSALKLPVKPRYIRGVIYDEQGNRLQGAAIWLKGTSLGTATYSNNIGEFQIELPPGFKTLNIIFVGYHLQELTPLLGVDFYKIVLIEDKDFRFAILLSARGNSRSKILTIPSCTKDTIAVKEEGNFKNQQLKPIKPIQPTFNKPVRSALRPGIIYVCGVVIAEEDQEPVPHTSIKIKGITIERMSDSKGNFCLILPVNFNVLIFSFIGFETKELKLTGSGFYTVVLKMYTRPINE